MPLPQVRFAFMNLLLTLNAMSLLVGGIWLWCGYAGSVFLASIVDEAMNDDDLTAPAARHPFYEAMLYATLPLMACNALLYAHYFTNIDPIGLAFALRRVGIDFDAARQATGGFSLAGAIIALGLFNAAAAANVGHELIHRTTSPVAMTCGRWLLAFLCDTNFAIEHVYGHHRHAATYEDPTTARRGEGLYFFLRRAMIGELRSAVDIETRRLQRRKLPFWSVSNRLLTGAMMSIVIVCAYEFIGGLWAVVGFILAAAQGKLHLEVNNYIAHYGLVRVPGAPIEARHSWNINRPISNAMLYNLTRHSNHHLSSSKPFWQLEMETNAPLISHGYMMIAARAFLPPLWRAMMDPLLIDWDHRFATPGELKYLSNLSLTTAIITTDRIASQSATNRSQEQSQCVPD